MNIKIYLIVFLSALGSLILSAIIGNILESNGTLNAATIGPKGINVVILAQFTLFCVMIVTFVPLIVRFFIFMQVKIGNEELFLVKFFQAHEQGVVYGFWIMMVIGFCVIVALAKDDILNSLK